MLNDNSMLNMQLVIVLLILSRTVAISYNLPKFCPNVSWYQNSTIFPAGNPIDYRAFGIFINTNNTVYINSQLANQVVMWLEGAVNPTNTVFYNMNIPLTVFVTDTGVIYADQGSATQVKEATINPNTNTVVMQTSSACTGLFVDMKNVLYCSMFVIHEVISKSLNNTLSALTTVAGGGSSGSSSTTLSQPHGIFVDITFRLYVADCGNDRIQRFDSGSLNGTTIVNNRTTATASLHCPTGIVLDSDNNLFIVDRAGQRIVQFGYNNIFQCIIGCTVTTRLVSPETLSFDSYGNIYVTGRYNAGIEKFNLATNSCDTPMTTQELYTTSITTTQSTMTVLSKTSAKTNQSSIFTTAIKSHESTTVTLNDAVSTTIASTSADYITNYDSVTTTNSITMVKPFLAPTCSNSAYIGIHCNISARPCDLLNPCQNNATCINMNISYRCRCLSGFNGTECQYDYRPCPPNRCWNNGTCKELTNTTFNCTCVANWTGDYCERKINYCENVICENRGVCRPLLGDYQCECLGESYSGRYCEISSKSMFIHQTISKLFALIAILAMLTVIAFVIIMDLLKYFFNIDPTRNQVKQIRKTKRHRPVIIRYIYQNRTP